jgi:hypothetical protein
MPIVLLLANHWMWTMLCIPQLHYNGTPINFQDYTARLLASARPAWSNRNSDCP